MAQVLPTIKLDKTLYDLYSLDGGNAEEVAVAVAIPPPGTGVASSFPVSKKYAYQAPRYPKLDPDIYARVCLGTGAMYHGFVAGPMSLYLFDIDKTKTERALASFSWTAPVPGHRIDAQQVYDQLTPEQRPKLGFIEKPSDLARIGATKKITSYTAIDCLDGVNTVVSQDVHYKLLSKRDLGFAPLPSPKTLVIDSVLSPSQVVDAKLVEAEAARMISPVQKRDLPFVVKMPQSLAGQGVMLVRTEAERADCLDVLAEETPRMIQSLTRENEHLKPVSIIVQEMLPGTAVALSLFITKAGRPIFIGCCEQVADERGYWSGAFVDYDRQELLEKQYAETAQKLANYVHGEGYYGPMGADVMTDNNEKQQVIDLNVRLTGSYIMGLLKGHFTSRGLHVASLLTPYALRGDREAFEQKFAQELEEGRIVIAGWCRGRGGPGGIFRYSICSLVVGAEDQTGLLEMISILNSMRIRK